MPQMSASSTNLARQLRNGALRGATTGGEEATVSGRVDMGCFYLCTIP
ncbi:hypothetical protein BDW27_10424 [Nocardiopsis sp. L17-MgMaSL7]|nr:hypothetical protein BDW27_10424 [Nocardiopsis sp. L17-MgMaSL7]